MKDWYNELTVQKVVLPTWPEETKERLTAYIEQFRNRGLTELVEPPKESVPKMKKDFQQVIEGLKTLVCEKIGEYDGWAEFQLLFAIPTFAVLNDTHFIKIGSYIDLKATEDLRDYIENLDKTKEIDLTEVKRHLAKEGAQVDLAIFLEQLIKEKPKRPGILTCWEQPSEFFVEKIFSLNRPNGKKLEGVIIKCEKRDNRVVFLLDDYLEVIIQKEPFEIQLISYRCYPHLIASIQSKLIQQGDTLTIRHPREAGDGAVILAGQYQLQELTGDNEYTLISPDQQRKYRVRAKLHGEIKIAKWDQANQRYDDKRSFSQDAFERCHIAWKKICESVSEINQSNADWCILIKPSPDEDELRRQRLKQVNEELDRLYQKFQGVENEPLMDALLDKFVKNGLKEIDVGLLKSKKPALVGDVTNLSNRYAELQIARTPAQILLKAVMDANYDSQVECNRISVARMMQSSLELNKHLNHLAGGDLLLFMGNAGAKSIAIDFLMRVRRDSHASAQNTNDDLKIEKSIYTQGVKKPGQSYFLVDCPSFNEGSGEADLLAHYSLDQAVQRANSLLSLVIVLPFSAFFFDDENSENSVTQLASRTKNLFPAAFDLQNPQGSANIHLLLTNQVYSKSGVAADSGAAEIIVEEFINEQCRQNDEMFKDNSNSLKKSFLERRQGIWTVLQQIHKSGRLHFINLRDPKEPKELLNLFSKKGTLNKQHYHPAMASDYIREKFGTSVGLAGNTWVMILEVFLSVLPEDLEKSLEEINKTKILLAQAETEKKEQYQRIQSLEEELEELTSRIKHLEKNEETVIDETLKQELVKVAVTSKGLESVINKDGKSCLRVLKDEITNLDARVCNLTEKTIEINEIIKRFKSRPLPTFEAFWMPLLAQWTINPFHFVPTASFVSTLNTTIGELERQVQTGKLSLDVAAKIASVIAQQKALSEAIAAFQGTQTECKKRLEEHRSEEIQRLVKERLKDTKQRLKVVEAEKKQLEDFTAIDQRIDEMKQKVGETEQKIGKLRKNRRNLAIVIKTEWKSAEVLREFCANLLKLLKEFRSELRGESAEDVIYQKMNLASTRRYCHEFIKLFDQHKDSLLQSIQKEYGF